MSSASRFASRPLGLARRRAVAGRADERLDLDEQRPAALERRGDDAARRRPAVIGRGTRGPDRRPRRRPRSAISNTPTSSVEPKRFLVARSRRSAGVALALERRRRRRRGARASWARRSSRPWSRGRRARRRSPRPWRAPSAARPTRGPGRRCPAAPSSSSTVAVWMESTTSSAGRSARASLDDPPDVVLGEDPDAARPPAASSRPRRAARSRTWPADSSPVAYRTRGAGGPGSGPRRPGAGAWTCRCRARRRAGRAIPATSPPPSTRSSSPIPRLQARQVGLGDARRGATGDVAADTAAGRRRARGRVGSRTTVSTSVFQPLARAALAFPAQERFAAALADEAALRPRHRLGRRTGGELTAPRPGCAAVRRGGCRGRPRRPCPRRSSSPARTCPAAGARRAASSIMFWMTRRSGRAP